MKDISIENIDVTQIAERKIFTWPIWKKISHFDWEYDSDEECYILNGNVIIETSEGVIQINTGDFFTFEKD